MAAMAGERCKRWRCRAVTQLGPADPVSSLLLSSSHRRLHFLTAELRAPVVIGGRKEVRARAEMGWGGRGRHYVPLHTRRSRSSTLLHGVCAGSCSPALPPLFLYRYQFEPDLLRLLLSLSCPAHAAAASSHLRSPVRTPLHIYLLLHSIHDSTRCKSSIRASSLPCVRRLCRPYAHSFYCTRARLPSALPGHLSTSPVGLSPLAPPSDAFRICSYTQRFVLMYACAICSSRRALQHRPLDLSPLSLRSALYTSRRSPVVSVLISILYPVLLAPRASRSLGLLPLVHSVAASAFFLFLLPCMAPPAGLHLLVEAKRD
ncbi:hypothetical protein B0H13DRAFT_2317740 [Mycena leptocephala]|nr:hypothetical protein B0H13DRAFT_2317740 [Mycena leptocephala]